MAGRPSGLRPPVHGLPGGENDAVQGESTHLRDGSGCLSGTRAADTTGADTGARAAAREARTVLDGHTGRVGVHAPYDGMPWASPDVRLVAALRDRLLESLEFTAALGGTHLVLHSPFLYFGSAQTRHRGAELADGIAHTLANLAPIATAAADQGCLLVWENIFDLRTDPLDALVAGEVRAPNPIYARLFNPTVDRFEQAMAVLEGSEEAVSFASGMAAITTPRAKVTNFTRKRQSPINQGRPAFCGSKRGHDPGIGIARRARLRQRRIGLSTILVRSGANTPELTNLGHRTTDGLCRALCAVT